MIDGSSLQNQRSEIVPTSANHLFGTISERHFCTVCRHRSLEREIVDETLTILDRASAVDCLGIHWPVSADTANTSQAVPTAPQATPEPIVTDEFSAFERHDGLLYWSWRCFVPGRSETGGTGSLLRRKPIAGGAISTLESESNCDNYKLMHPTDDGIYYYNDADNQIEFIPIDLGNTPQTITAVLGVAKGLVVDDDYVYYARGTGGIYRADKDGGTATLFISTGISLRDLHQNGSLLYWTDSSGLWVESKSCTSSCTGTQLSVATAADHVLNAAAPASFNSAVYFVEQFGNTYRIRYYTCTPIINGCNSLTTTLYTAPTGSTIGELDTISVFVGPPIFTQTYIVFTERHATNDVGRVLRKPLSSGLAEEIHTGAANINPQIAADNSYIYFGRHLSGTDQIYRLPKSAAPIVRDFSAEAVEVTQAIQNLANDVPLVADKPTYVRLYGAQSAGPRAGSVEARLVGTRNGSPLLGSPLQPLNGSRVLSTSFAFDRADLDDGWLFELPASWLAAGSVTLQGVVNPRGTYADSNSADNIITTNVTFDNEPNACILFTPVETHTPLPRVGDPNFWESMDLATRLWPVAGMDVHWLGETVSEFEFCSKWGVPYPCFGPYELQQGSSITNFPSDENRVIGKLMLRQIAFSALAATPGSGVCEGGASVHTVGMVHPQAPTMNNNNKTGLGNYYLSASWVKFTDHAQTGPSGSLPIWTFPASGATLAHEMTHNFNRRHVNCGGPDDLDNNYPYPPCQLDNAGSNNHYGFDGASLSPIAPNMGADYMSYSRRRWVSDYTYEAVKGQFGRFERLTTGRNLRNTPTTSLRGADTIVTISGFIDTDDTQGTLSYAYTLPTNTMREEVIGVYDNYQTPAYEHTRGSGYHLRLKDENGTVWVDQAITVNLPTLSEENGAVAPFFLTFPAPPTTITTIELLDGTTVLDTLTPGVGQPSVNVISQPTGSSFSDTFTIEWNASDADSADELLYNVDYSRDGGTSWYPLVTDYAGAPNETVRLPLQNPFSTPGTISNTAQIRVTASDGYNTTVAHSGLFTVGDRTPIAGITSPAKNAWVMAGEPIILRGSALDAEDGILSNLSWQLDGTHISATNGIAINGLAPGQHTVRLTATDSISNQVSAEHNFHVAPLELPEQSSTLSLDGTCDDSAYDSGETLQLAPYASGIQATAMLLRRADAWYVCISGLIDGSDVILGRAGIHLDLAADGGSSPQSGDLAFFVDQAGTPSAWEGDGNSYVSRSVAGLETWVAGSSALWSAEMRIEASLLDPLPADAGIVLGHYLVDFTGIAYQWPYAANAASPATYAYTLLDPPPDVTGMSPTAAPVGEPSVQVVISGTDFAQTSQVLWNGTALPTSFISTSELSLTLTTQQLAASGAFSVTVVDTSLSDAPVAPRTFLVNNPLPNLTTITPDTVEQSEEVTVSVMGTNFVVGSQILLDGQAVPSTFVNATELMGVISAELLPPERDSNLVVVNPAPGGGVSNILTVTVENNTPTAITLAPTQSDPTASTLTLILVALLTFVVYFTYSHQRSNN